jgi:hypothetical protein
MRMNSDNDHAHFFAASAATWGVTTPGRTLKELLTLMEKEGYAFNLFFVPVPYNTNYEIKMYQPQVDGATYLGFFVPAKKGESK